MGMTMTQKILAKHAGLESVTAGQLIEAKRRSRAGQTISPVPVAIRRDWRRRASIRCSTTAKIAHGDGPLCTEQGHQVRRAVPRSAATFSRKYNIVNFFDVGAMGIEHALLPEKGLTAPGELHHRRGLATPAPTARWAHSPPASALPIWPQAWPTGKAWFKVPCAIKFYAHRQAPARGSSGKDVILHIIGMIGVDGALYKSMEFAGEGVHTRCPWMTA